jgi:hypothetical protein
LDLQNANKLHYITNNKNLATEGAALTVGNKGGLDKVADKSLQNVKRKSTEGSQLLSKIDVR